MVLSQFKKIVVTMGDMTVKEWETLLQFKSSQSSNYCQFYASEASRDKGIESVKNLRQPLKI